MAIKKVKLKSGAVRYRVTVNARLVAGKRKNIVRNVQSIQKARLLESKLKVDVANVYMMKKTLPHRFRPLVICTISGGRSMFKLWKEVQPIKQSSFSITT